MHSEHILKHYRKEEQPFIEKTIDSCERILRNHQPILTDFVDPRQRTIVQNIVNSYMDLAMFFDGGYEFAERGRILLAPSYYVPEDKEIGLHFFQVEGESKFFDLAHKDIMGALLNIGLKREKFGDILITDETKQLIVADEIADYVRMEVQQIGKTRVLLGSIQRERVNPARTEYKELTFTVSSLRIDAIVSHVFNQSRSKVADWIKGKHVKVNWQVVDQVDFKLEEGDIVSVRKFGRFRFLSEEGNTKKGRILIKVGKIV